MTEELAAAGRVQHVLERVGEPGEHVEGEDRRRSPSACGRCGRPRRPRLVVVRSALERRAPRSPGGPEVLLGIRKEELHQRRTIDIHGARTRIGGSLRELEDKARVSCRCAQESARLNSAADPPICGVIPVNRPGIMVVAQSLNEAVLLAISDLDRAQSRASDRPGRPRPPIPTSSSGSSRPKTRSVATRPSRPLPGGGGRSVPALRAGARRSRIPRW